MRCLRLLVVPAAFVGAVVVLLCAGGGELDVPGPDRLFTWADAVGPIVVVVALLRLAAIAGAAAMLVVSVVSTVARIVGAEGVAAFADRALPSPVRAALAALVGAGVVGVVTVGAPGPGPVAAATPTPVERIVRLPADPADPPEVETMSVLPDDPLPPADPVPAAPPVPIGPDSWTVEPGDSFWSIADEALADALGRRPTDDELEPYWLRVIDANRDRLVTGDPDLIFRGQVFVVPPPG